MVPTHERRCPSCGSSLLEGAGCERPRPGGPAFPFCSERCKLIDLGAWLGGTHSIAADDRVDTSQPSGRSDVGEP